MPDKIKVKVVQNKTVLVNQSGVLSVRKISDLLDVDLSAKEDGSLLIYDEQEDKFKASRLLEKQQINGGHF